MKVYYVAAGYDSCYYVRCLLPLRANGWNGDIYSLHTPRVPWEKAFHQAMEADIIVMQRPMWPDRLQAVKYFKQMNKVVVFDNDDTYTPKAGVPELMTKFQETAVDKKLDYFDTILKEAASISDLVCVTTPTLAKEYEEVNKNVVVLPNMVDPFDWPEEPQRNEDKKIRVGLVGSVINADYTIIENLLKKISEDDRYQLVVMGLPPDNEKYKWSRNNVFKKPIKFWNSLDVEWHPFVAIQDYINTVDDLKLDIMLIPRIDNHFNRCKSDVKFLESSMLEIPVIASRFEDGEYNKHDGNLLLAWDEDEWFEHLEKLTNKRSRRMLGRKARKYVTEKYDINKTAHLWEKEFKKLIK